VGSQHDVGELQEIRMQRRFVLEHVETGGGKGAVLQRLDERRVIDHAAARGVDEDGAGFHFRELRRAQDVVGGRRIRRVHGKNIGAREQLIHTYIRRVAAFFHFRRQTA
jgi:hypothetical protein